MYRWKKVRSLRRAGMKWRAFNNEPASKGKFTLVPAILEKYFLNTFLKIQKVIHIVWLHGGVFQKNVYKFHFLLAGITFFAKIISVVDCFMQFSFIWCRGQKPPTLMPTDCSVLRTPTILPNIRISWDYHPTFMLISGRVLRSFTHLWASSCGLRPFDPGIFYIL